MRKLKETLLYFLFIVNVAIISLYLAFSFFDVIKISDNNLTILLIYGIFITIVFSELVLKHKKNDQ
jgi:hypothetical protein